MKKPDEPKGEPPSGWENVRTLTGWDPATGVFRMWCPPPPPPPDLPGRETPSAKVIPLFKRVSDEGEDHPDEADDF